MDLAKKVSDSPNTPQLEWNDSTMDGLLLLT